LIIYSDKKCIKPEKMPFYRPKFYLDGFRSIYCCILRLSQRLTFSSKKIDKGPGMAWWGGTADIASAYRTEAVGSNPGANPTPSDFTTATPAL
jgi:hypothetical protein